MPDPTSIVAVTQSLDVWLARTFSILVAFTSLGIAYGAGVVFKWYLLLFREEIATWRLLTPEQRMCTTGVKPTFNTHAIVIVTVAVALECIPWAILDVGQAFNLIVDGWGAIVGIIGTLILPLLGFKSVQTITAGKTSVATVNGASQ